MKKLIAILLISATSFAAEAPTYLKDAVITVTLKGGKTYTYSANKYAVVLRSSMGKAMMATPTEPSKSSVVNYNAVYVSEVTAGPNTVKVFSGVGPNGFSAATTPGHATISQDYDVLFGVGYSRQFTPRWSLEAIGLSNKTGILGAGYSF